MAKIIDTYTETATHKDEKLEVTINVFDQPCLRADDKQYYTQILVTKHGRPWGSSYLLDPLDPETFKESVQDVKKILDQIKMTTINESNQKRISQN